MRKCVGYQNKGLRQGFKLVGTIFQNIGSEDGSMMLSDIKPVGYEANEDLIEQGYTAGELSLLLLSNDGGEEAYFEWTARYDKAAGAWKPGYWDDDMELPIGQGLWFCCDAFNDGVALESAGEALVEAQNIPLRQGFSPITIPVARSVELAEIKPVGYDNCEELIDQGYTAGEFSMLILSEDGGEEAYFEWTARYDKTAGAWKPGYWDDDYTFEAGDAIWFCSDVFEEGFALSFPGLDEADE